MGGCFGGIGFNLHAFHDNRGVIGAVGKGRVGTCVIKQIRFGL